MKRSEGHGMAFRAEYGVVYNTILCDIQIVSTETRLKDAMITKMIVIHLACSTCAARPARPLREEIVSSYLVSESMTSPSLVFDHIAVEVSSTAR